MLQNMFLYILCEYMSADFDVALCFDYILISLASFWNHNDRFLEKTNILPYNFQ